VDVSLLETEDGTASTLAGTDWKTRAVCHGRSGAFFAPAGERPEARRSRESIAAAICETCPVMGPCRLWARANREYGFWGGESEEDRAAAGFRVQMPVGRLAQYPSGEGEPVQPRRPLRRRNVSEQ
jgi:WhiB family redox-sensing transcriptional regulator